MNILDYFYEGNEFFNTLMSYPLWLTAQIRDEVERIAQYDYGMRKIRPYLEYLTTREDPDHIIPSIDAVVKTAIQSYVYKYSYKFEKLFATQNLEYDPIENYSMTEQMHNDTTETSYGKVDTKTMSKNSQDQRNLNFSDNRTLDTADETTPNLTDTHTLNNLTTTETDTIAGFNSAGFENANQKTSVGTGSETNATTGTSTTTHTGTDNVSHSGTDTVVYSGMDTDTDTLSGKDTNVRNYTLTRSGNIGVTTSQQMIESERNVADFSALQELTHGIINAITIGVF